MLKRLAITLLICALAACSGVPRPDLKRLYSPSPDLRALHEDGVEDQFQNPVVFIHGVFGARLRRKETGQEVWPGSFARILFHDYEEVSLPIDPETLLPADSDLEAYAITDEAIGRDFYGQIMRTLEQVGGYVHTKPGIRAAHNERRYYVFVYDWRQDNVQTARKLDRFIEQIRADYADQKLKVDIVAHSMGGLVARYYIRYGTADVLDDNEFPINHHGASRVRKVILLGTPNLGSVSAVQEFLLGFKVGLRRIPPETLATMPSAFQLFPHPIYSYMIKSDGEELDRDLFDAHTWYRFQWSIFDPSVQERIVSKFPTRQAGEAYLNVLQRYFEKHIERARRFVWSLTVSMDETPVRLVVFGGDCEMTPARILVEEIDGESVVRLQPDKVAKRLPGVDYEQLMLEPGDGRVTKPSLLARHALNPAIPRHKYSFFPLDYSFFLCESHDKLTGNVSFQNNLLNILLTRDGS